jgi:glutathione synthase/RimK-type ligase-like ATP-grasp enzyme
MALTQESKPIVVFAFSNEGSTTSTKYAGFAKRIQRHGALKNTKIITVALENLVFVVQEDKSAVVYDPVADFYLGDADFVYFKSWTKAKSEACALAHYLTGRGIPFIDSVVLGIDDSKLSTTFKLWRNNIPVPLTVYSRKPKNIINYELNHKLLGKKFIAKDINGEKGKNNFAVTLKEFEKTVEASPAIHFICQRYIPNDGDMRIGIYASMPSFALFRKSGGNSHLNNTSAGGTAELIKVSDLNNKIKTMAVKAAEGSELQVAGVDIITDKLTGKYFVLEVNQGSQIVTGAFVEENIAGFGAALEAVISKRKAKSRQKTMTTIGRRAKVQLPEIGVIGATAKIDTGAYTSSIHVENIKLIDGSVLTYEIHPKDGYATTDGKPQIIRTTDFFVQKVRSSNGSIQERYTINTKMVIGGKRIRATVTLSDRSDMGYPILIGRRIIRSRFLVNVELNENNQEQWKY